MNVVERFLKYVRFDTKSDPSSTTSPSSASQLVLAQALVEEMMALGIQNAHVDEYGVVYGSIPANVEGVAPIGFIAHMDTSPDMSGKDVNPRVIEHYDGSCIVLHEAKNITMSAEQFPVLNSKIGEDLIVTDGTTLLGADDKAGIAEIMSMAEVIVSSDIPHGTIQIAFTPDEEIGRGADHFDVAGFGAAFAYTVDGGEVDSVDYENFNAASAEVKIQGQSIHPGDAKGKMVNASLVAMQFHQMLPVFDNPAYTQGYEGFHHLTDMKGECEQASLSYIIRNHDEALFAKQKQEFLRVAAYLNETYGEHSVEVEIKDSYANMRQIIEKDMQIIDLVKTSMQDIGITPTSHAIRGGTDGARLTYEGLPCPNLGTGGYNYHGKYEFASINEMKQSVALLVKIVENHAKNR